MNHGLPLCLGKIVRRLVIVVVFVARHAAHGGLRPERLLKRLQHALHLWIIGGQHAKLKKGAHAAIQRLVAGDRAILSDGQHTQKMAALLIPQVVERRLLNLFGGLAILRSLFLFAKEVREIGGGIPVADGVPRG